MTDVKPKILIVDDEPNNHRVYERTLAPLKLEFIKAMSGQQALAAAHKHDFFLILMDVQMPGMDGFETAQLILDHPKTCHIPVIFITAFSWDEVFELKGYTSGAVDYLVKPINDDIVRSKVGVFLELYNERQELNRICKIQQQTEAQLWVQQDQLENLVNKRTVELQNTIENLMQTQSQLVESEKMASLGALVAGVAHELNTPLGVCVTSASFLQGKVNQLAESWSDGNLRKGELASFIESAPQSTDIILSNLMRACEIITNFKFVAVDISTTLVRELNVYDYFTKVLQSLNEQIKSGKHCVNLEGDSALKVTTSPGSLCQIITNLVNNSTIHGFDGIEGGQITIRIVKEQQRLKLTYGDNGKGMTAEQQALIFEPFYTTKRGNGRSGLGLSIVYNLITQTLRGDIICSSEVGKGTTFDITFPLISRLN
ncbi:MAG: hybrid sensor histidine kinase/response regulator [Algicola sp.]|nr:hybrid sensor histidine kinase/response regulator [Algicola sp.]